MRSSRTGKLLRRSCGGHTPEPDRYARTLFALEQRRIAWTPSLAASDGQLLDRIRRLIGTPTRTNLDRQWGKGLAGFVVLLLLVSVPLAAVVLSLGSQSHVLANDESKNDANSAAHKESSVVPPPRPTGRSVAGAVPSPAIAGYLDAAPPPAVRVVVGPNNDLTFEGEKTTWDTLSALLQKVPDPSSKVLEVAISTDDLSVREMNDAVGNASHFGRMFGFKYSSYIGVHPLGSKGSSLQTHRVVFTPQHGMAKETSWTELVKQPDGPDEHLQAQVPLEGEFPVKREGDKSRYSR